MTQKECVWVMSVAVGVGVGGAGTARQGPAAWHTTPTSPA